MTTPAQTHVTRQLPLNGCFNFRDVGGRHAADGRMVAWRFLFRADGPRGLTPLDVDVISTLRLRTVIDLRTEAEIDEGARYADCLDVEASHHLPMSEGLPDADQLHLWSDPAHVAAYYLDKLATTSESIAEALAVLTDPSAYPALVHCSVGKDRTGVLVAIVLGLIGVSDDEIVDDYAASRAGMERLLASLDRAAPEVQERIEAFRPAILSADPETMRLFLAGLKGAYGSFDGFAASIGLPGVGRFLGERLLQ